MAKWKEPQPEENYRQVLRPDGTLASEPPALDDGELRRFYRVLRGTRIFEEKALSLQRQGDISAYARSLGEEAIPLAAAAALSPGDWLFPSYRQIAAFLYWEYPLAHLFAEPMGYEPQTIETHLGEPDTDVTLLPEYAPLATNTVNAVGAAMSECFGDGDDAARHDNVNVNADIDSDADTDSNGDSDGDGRTVTLSFLGDGSTSEGDFHDALNFAGVFDAPAVVVCHNNQWATTVPVYRQTAAETIAKKGEAYGVPHERVDGNDVFAVYQAAREATDRARRGDGPTFIECVTYRRGEHTTADDPSVYRSDEMQAYWEERDPIDRFETYLLEEGVLDEERVAAIETETQRAVDGAADRAREIPRSEPQLLFENHLHGDSWTHRQHAAELARELAGENPFTDFTGEGFQ